VQKPFVDYYEVLQLSPRATADMVERVYRFLAKRFHPDNLETGDSERFGKIHEAYQVLNDPERRAAYDVAYENVQSVQWKVFDQAAATDGRAEDRQIIHAILSLLYVERRRDPMRGGLGAIVLERMLGVPQEHLQFPLWYVKQHGWIEVLDSGQIAITIAGIDKLSNSDLELRKDRLLPASTLASEPDHDDADRILTRGNRATDTH
jgi:curved DNA-binding protein CbpA